VFRVPLFMLGNMDKATFANVEQMMRSFLAGGLGFYLQNIETKINHFFNLPPDERVRFDVEGGLLRTEFRDRIEGLVRGVQGGVYAINEARRREGLPAVDNGDGPLVQQQMVSLEYAASQTVEPVEPAPDPNESIDEESIKAAVRKSLKVAA
jgi:phage portal protein BeeE